MKKNIKNTCMNGFHAEYMMLLLTVMIIGVSCKKELKASDPLPLIYSSVYIVGDASAAKWDIAAALPMIVNPSNSAEFTWTGPLVAGEIKFPTLRNWTADCFMSATAAQPISNNKAQIALGGNPDLKWKLSAAEAGNYKITVDMKAITVSFQKL
ncbi:SusF/SusE family outer membrane protein [Pedobacter chinensis]|uniref:SusF/SusE family outer membrane protein n=1 Tax=Pedobacter chinensis TaxID=2282421 RepID=A0A369PWS9_9SPHI|nr:SusF/SusE family outer membrane protein [Pedobacter chinensis]RDC55447.1 SusF/SusE family outer membrane protein [Pedobacter chinensis]